MITFEYLLTSLIVVLLPGTGVIYTLALGLGRGTKASIWAALGCTLGIVPHMAACILGLSALLHTSAVAFEIVRYLGVAWLVYMAWGMWHGTGAMKVTAHNSPTGLVKILCDGVLLNLLNPKLSLFFVAFLPQFVSANTLDTTGEMIALGLIFMAITFGVFAVYGVFAASFRHHIIERPAVMRWLGRGFATAFLAMGVKLLTAGR